MAALGFNTMNSKSQSMDEISSVEAEESSGTRNRRCSFDMTPGHFDGTLLECSSASGKSAEPDLMQETEISDDVRTEIDSRSMGTYLVVPGQSPVPKTPPDGRRSSSFVYSQDKKELSLDGVPPSPLLLHDSSLETEADMLHSAESNVTDYSHFQVLESVLQQSSSSGVRDGFISPQTTCLDSDCSSGTEGTPLQCASSNDSLDTAGNEHLFHVCEEHVAQQRIVSVDREQCITKEQAAMSVVKDGNASSRCHHAVTVSRSPTWSFPAKPDQVLAEIDAVRKEDGAIADSTDQLLNETFTHDTDHAVKPSRHSVPEPPVSSAFQSSCLLRDYNKDNDWSSVPWTDESGNQ